MKTWQKLELESTQQYQKMGETEEFRDRKIRKERERKEKNLDLVDKVCDQMF